MSAISESSRTCFSSSNFPFSSRKTSSSTARSKWSSIERLLRPGDDQDVGEARARPPPRRPAGSPACRRPGASPWAGLRRRQEPGAEAGGGDDGFPDLHAILHGVGAEASPYPGCALGASSGRCTAFGQRSAGTLDLVMPTYEYVCRSCGHLFEIVQSMRDETLTECPECGGELRKVFAPPAISFKGSGFYATDHGKKKSKPAGDKKADAGSGSGSGSGSRSQGRVLAPAPPRRRPTRSRPPRRRRTRPRARRRPRRMRADRELGRHRRLRRLGLLLLPRGHRDRRGRDAVRLAERPRHDRRDRRPAGGVPAAARLAPRVPAAPDPVQGEPVGDEGARRGPGARAERLRLAPGRA